MVNFCKKCNKVINEGEEIEMTLQGLYRLIPSIKTFALYKQGLIYVPESLQHQDCGEELV